MQLIQRYNQMLEGLDNVPSFKWFVPLGIILIPFLVKRLQELDSYFAPNLGIGFMALIFLMIIPCYMFLFVLWLLLMYKKYWVIENDKKL